jgi:L-ascorbate metabolism protein UlaG (beta-lactamase superfamily)
VVKVVQNDSGDNKPMKITKYPQSAILIEYKNKKILIDPGSYCYNENFTAHDWGKIDILLITHIHNDHCFSPAVKIIKGNNQNLVLLSNSQVKEKLALENIDCEILKAGQERQVDDIKIKGVESIHGELPNGKPKPDVIGFLIDNAFYHPGDTIYLDQKPKAQIVFVPMCGTVVMNPKEATKFCSEINPELSIPIHYDNPNYITDTVEFEKEMQGQNFKVLKNGESVEMD